MIDEYAFYYHEPSGEYRLLLRRLRGRSWFILSTGTTEPREVNLCAWLPETMGITTLLRTTPVALQGRLHWPPRQAAGAPVVAAAGESETATTMVVFDTLSETFHLMAGPPTATAYQTKVFDLAGQLVAADFGGEEHVDLWFLEDYNAGKWERRHRAPTPWHTGTLGVPEPEWRGPNSVAAAGDDREGIVMLGNHLGLLVYNLRTRTARAVDSVAASEHNIVVSRHVFRENLKQHPSFAARSAAELGVNIFWY